MNDLAWIAHGWITEIVLMLAWPFVLLSKVVEHLRMMHDRYQETQT